MKPAIHYEFIAKLIKRKKEDGEFEFIETMKEFIDDEPMIAREKALKYYQNYVEVLLESRGLKYESDRQAREALKSFYDPLTSINHEVLGGELELLDYLGNGIGVFMIIDEILEKNTYPESSFNNNLELIHGMGNLIEGFFDADSLTLSLERELFYYKHFKYNTGNYLTMIVFCNSGEWLDGERDDEPNEYTILKTPFDWTGMDKPYWWGEPEEEEERESEKDNVTYEDIIAKGESNQIEFKPSLLYNFKTESAGIGVKGIIAKSICAFLNSKGGFLFIGVSDDGNIQGLKYDFSLSKEKQAKDFFRLEFDDTVKQFLPLPAKTYISGDFVKVQNKEIFVVSVFPSKRPIFMKGQYGKEFWVRWTASTKLYEDIEDITSYCLEHWRDNT